MHAAHDVLEVMSEYARTCISFDEPPFPQEARALEVPAVGCRACTVQMYQEQSNHVAGFVRIFMGKVDIYWISPGSLFALE